MAVTACAIVYKLTSEYITDRIADVTCPHCKRTDDYIDAELYEYEFYFGFSLGF